MAAGFPIYGLVNPLRESPCFALPVFGHQAGLCVQALGSQGTITSFVPFSISEASVLKIESGLTRSLREPGLHAFYFGPTDLFIGTEQQLASSLRDRWDEFEHKPFLRVEIADFLQDDELATQAVEEASSALATVSKTAALYWVAQVSRSRAETSQSVIATRVGESSKAPMDGGKKKKVAKKKGSGKVRKEPGKSASAPGSRKRATLKRSQQNILVTGWGDLIRKAAPAIAEFKKAGYQIAALDIRENPSALPHIQPDTFFIHGNKRHYRQLLTIGRNKGFAANYIATPGDFHMFSVTEFQHYTERIIVSKPLDTHVQFLNTIESGADTVFRYLLEKTFVHDHYLNKPGVEFLIDLMPQLHSESFFLERIQMYLVERAGIETEQHRLHALNCGVLFDSAVHLLSILDQLIPPLAQWSTSDVFYERTSRHIEVRACRTARYAGTVLGESTVIPSRKAETFGVMELQISETILRFAPGQDPRNDPPANVLERTIPVLIVVGKGVPIDASSTRDLKCIGMEFSDGRVITLDLDTYNIQGVDDRFLNSGKCRVKFSDLEWVQRGINRPLIQAVNNGFRLDKIKNPFQGWAPAMRSVSLLNDALRMDPEESFPYGNHTWCRELIVALLQQDARFKKWKLPANLGNLIGGAIPAQPIA